MSSLAFLIPALLAIMVSFLIVRGASIALMLTGLEKKKARFQALSAFTGTGYTTKESESIVNHPRRRQIIRYLMIMGNAGIVTVIVTATSSMTTSQGYQLPINALVLIVGVFLIYKIATYRKFTRKWESFIEKKLIKSPAFEETSTEDLLHFLEGYGLIKKIVGDKSSLIGTSLAEGHLRGKGVMVLGIERGKSWMPIPGANEIIHEGDHIVVYGPLNTLRDLLDVEE